MDAVGRPGFDGLRQLPSVGDWVFAVGKGRERPWVIQPPNGVQVCKDGQELRFTSAEWTAFRAGVNDGECVLVGV